MPKNRITDINRAKKKVIFLPFGLLFFFFFFFFPESSSGGRGLLSISSKSGAYSVFTSLMASFILACSARMLSLMTASSLLRSFFTGFAVSFFGSGFLGVLAVFSFTAFISRTSAGSAFFTGLDETSFFISFTSFFSTSLNTGVSILRPLSSFSRSVVISSRTCFKVSSSGISFSLISLFFSLFSFFIAFFIITSNFVYFMGNTTLSTAFSSR